MRAKQFWKNEPPAPHDLQAAGVGQSASLFKKPSQNKYQALLQDFASNLDPVAGYEDIEAPGDEIIPLEELPVDNQKIVVFDDLVCESNQNSIDGNFDMDGKKLLNLRVLPDAPVVGDYDDYVKDLRSGVNKEYLNEKFLKNDAGGDYFDLKGSKFRHSEPYYDGLFGDRDLVTKEKVFIQDDKQDIAINDKLSKDGSGKMGGALDMNNNKIINVGDTTEQDGDAINY